MRLWWIERSLSRWARHPGWCVVGVGVLAFLLHASIALWVEMPVPAVHDEFGYLLQADTFSHGRLTNPTHPMWEHFESFHIFFQPTYNAIYPPGTGMMLALGQWLTGMPVVGLWLSIGLACGTVCWALMGWLPPRWGLVGGLLALMHGTMLYWGQWYCPGAAAVFGGALVVGAWPRIVWRQEIRAAWVLGLGMFVLAHTRPYEGLVMSVLAAGSAVVLLIRSERPVPWLRLGIPMVVTGLLVLGTMGYYNWRVTGSPLRMPWLHGQAIYSKVPAFVWQAPPNRPDPVYRHEVIRDWRLNSEMNLYYRYRTLAGFTQAMWEKIELCFWTFFDPLFLSLFFVVALWAILSERWLWWPLWWLLLYVVAVMMNVGMLLHYIAVGFPLALLLVVAGWRRLCLWCWRARIGGRLIAYALFVVLLLYLPFRIWSFPRRPNWQAWAVDREYLLNHLEHRDGRHLVIVRYAHGHPPYMEWVYNKADIDSAKVVWARDMGSERNRELFSYFHKRQIWLLEADATSLRLVPYMGLDRGRL